jgi:predicted dehydrogenase
VDERDVAVFGCGDWGIRIVRTISRLGRLRVVVDPSHAVRAAAHRAAAEAQVTDRVGPVLADRAVRAVVVATPAETHFRLARAALDAGKDVLVEKPLATDLPDARELVARASAVDRVLMVGHLLEYHPAVLRVLELVRGGELGEIRYVVCERLGLNGARTPESDPWSCAEIAVVLRLLRAMPADVVATGGSYLRPGFADVTLTQLRFEKEARCHVFVSWRYPVYQRRLVVIGSRSMVVWDGVAGLLLMNDQDVGVRPGRPAGPDGSRSVDVHFPADDPLEQQCRHFLQCVETRQRPRTDGESAVRVLQILAASRRSLALNGRPVPLASEISSRHGPRTPRRRARPRSVAAAAAPPGAA